MGTEPQIMGKKGTKQAGRLRLLCSFPTIRSSARAYVRKYIRSIS